MLFKTFFCHYSDNFPGANSSRLQNIYQSPQTPSPLRNGFMEESSKTPGIWTSPSKIIGYDKKDAKIRDLEERIKLMQLPFSKSIPKEEQELPLDSLPPLLTEKQIGKWPVYVASLLENVDYGSAEYLKILSERKDGTVYSRLEQKEKGNTLFPVVDSEDDAQSKKTVVSDESGISEVKPAEPTPPFKTLNSTFNGHIKTPILMKKQSSLPEDVISLSQPNLPAPLNNVSKSFEKLTTNETIEPAVEIKKSGSFSGFKNFFKKIRKKSDT
ncbi:hypothetical protein HDU92_005707 [Lobulomyces angularis]|nr:hypothetical protein HDU92_005707 [Lobulomyces angularis]